MAGGKKNFEERDERNPNCLEQAVCRNMDIKDSAGENSARSEKHYRENLDFL